MFLYVHSFSGEIDGKGLDCSLNRLIETKETKGKEKFWNEMFWFNNGMVQKVRGGHPKHEYPKRKRMKKSDYFSFEYNTNDNNIFWSGAPSAWFYAVDRKELTFVLKSRVENAAVPLKQRKWQIEIVGKCSVFKGFKEVKKKHAEMREEWKKVFKESQRKKEEEKRKAREGNKI